MSLAAVVAKNIHAARARLNQSQGTVAVKAGLSVSYVSMLERGTRTPTPETVESLAKALGVRPLELLGLTKSARRRPRG